jgi:hypothetical protein
MWEPVLSVGFADAQDRFMKKWNPLVDQRSENEIDVG